MSEVGGVWGRRQQGVERMGRRGGALQTEPGRQKRRASQHCEMRNREGKIAIWA